MADAFQQTNAAAIRFFGGDEVIRGALKGLELDVEVDGAAFVFRHAPPLPVKVTLREGSMRDSLVLGEMAREQAANFDDPKILIAEIGHEAVGGVANEGRLVCAGIHVLHERTRLPSSAAGSGWATTTSQPRDNSTSPL